MRVELTARSGISALCCTHVAALLILGGCGRMGRATPATLSPAPTPFTSEQRAAAGAALDALSRTLRDTAAACVMLVLDGHPADPDSGFLAERTPERRFVARGACPPTYLTAAGPLRDSLGRPVPRPLGYPDPHHIRLYRPLFVHPIEAELRIIREQGTWTYYYACRVKADSLERRAWQASCREIDRTVS